MRLLLFLLLAAAAACRAAAASGDSRRLALDGKSRVTVVVRPGGGPLAQAAAHDLARCLGRALDVRVPLDEGGAEVDTPLAIVVGATDGLDLSGIAHDGCVLKTVGDRLLIGGVADSGIANGVYTYLMDYLGARWLLPMPLFERVPSKPDAVLPEIDYRHNPDFSYRIFSGARGPAASDWLRFNRIDTTTRDLPRWGFGHNLRTIFPPSKYGKDHPEYYAMIDGKRQVPTRDDEQFANPCFTNPDVIRIAAEAAHRYFSEHPDHTAFSLCINDTGDFCHCPTCQKLDAGAPKSQDGDETCSDSYFHFVTEVAKIVAKTDPGKSLGCYAYWCVEPPSRSIEHLPDNVVIELTQDTSQHFDKAYRDRDRALWTAWSKKVRYLGQYDYYGLGWITPRAYPHLAAEDLKFVRPHADGLYCEIYPNWAFTAPQVYMASRLLWDARQSPDALLDDFCKRAFGPGAPAMRRFYDILEKYWTQPRKGRWFEGLMDVRDELALANDDLIEQAFDCLCEAETIADGADRSRVEFVKSHMRLPYIIIRATANGRALAAAPLTDAGRLDDTAHEIEMLLRAVPQAHTEYADYWVRDPLYGQNYYLPKTVDPKLDVWAKQIDTDVVTVVRKAYALCHGAAAPANGAAAWDAFRAKLLAISGIDTRPLVDEATKSGK